MNIFKAKEKNEDPSAVIERLESKRIEIIEKKNQFEKDYGLALLNYEEVGDKETKADAETISKALGRLESELKAIDLAIFAAKEKHREYLFQIKKEHNNKKIEAAASLGTKRLKVAKQIQQSIYKLTQQMNDLVGLSEEQYKTFPLDLELGLHESALSPKFITASIRKNLVKNGHNWAFKWPWAHSEIESIEEIVKEGNGWLSKHTDKMLPPNTINE